MITEKHLDYCVTDTQKERVQAYLDYGSQYKAADAMGCTRSKMQQTLRQVRVRAAKAGYAPEHGMIDTAPDGFSVKGTSTLYDRRSGETVMQWVKTNQDQERQLELMRQFIDAAKEDIPKESAVPAPKHQPKDNLLNCHILTDYHFGMLSWSEETGEDWDVEIAERLLIGWFKLAIDQAPAAQVGVLAQLGDLLHFDGLEAVTPTNKHILDADTRFAHLVRAVVRSLRTIIRIMLTKYPKVHIIMSDANHDPSSAVLLRELLAALYDEEPRITVDTSPDTYNCVEWGNTSIFFHHGHKRTVNDVSDVFAAKFRAVFGRTKYSYAHMGHRHHDHEKETNLMLVKQHRTMAAKDAYASRGGWMSGRSAEVITYHKDKGKVGAITITPEMVEDPTPDTSAG